jgi:transposase
LDKQEYFLKEFERFIANKAKNEAVFFMDAVHPAHNSMPAYGWMRKGKKTDLKSNPGRQRLNIHGAMNAETYEVVPLISESSVNSDSTISLLKYLEMLYPLATKIYVFLDNARYHYTKEIQEWEKTSRVKLIFLPPYSPELNLIERLWRVFKKNVLYKNITKRLMSLNQRATVSSRTKTTTMMRFARSWGAGLKVHPWGLDQENLKIIRNHYTNYMLHNFRIYNNSLGSIIT